MRRLLTVAATVVAALIAVALAFGAFSNPETRVLDAAARAEAPGRFIASDQGNTHYELAGPDGGRTVVLVHGFSVPYYIWDSTSAGLTRAGYRVLRYDLYGRGYSDRPDAAYDGAMYDRQLLSLLDSLRITGPVDVAGLSFGGFATAHFATTHPSRVRALTLVDPVVEPSDPGVVALPVIGPWLWQSLVVPGMAEGQLTDFLHPENHPAWVDQYRRQMRYRGFGRALRRTALNMASVDFDALYARVAATGVPVLLVWGKQDQTIPFTLSDVVRRNIPSVEFVAVDSAGHLPHIEQASLVNARLLAFLAAHSSN